MHFSVAVEQGCEAVVQILLNAGADFDDARFDGATPLYVAAQEGYGPVVQLLLGARADLDQAQEDGAFSVDSFPSSSSDDASKRLKTMASNISKHLLCAITQELMVDPVLAEDGRTYERSAIVKWLATKSTSPLDPSCRLDVSRLMTNRAMKEQIEELVESGELDDALCAGYPARAGGGVCGCCGSRVSLLAWYTVYRISAAALLSRVGSVDC